MTEVRSVIMCGPRRWPAGLERVATRLPTSHCAVSPCALKERRREAERVAREREELRRQQQQLRYEQEKRSALKRPRDVDHRYPGQSHATGLGRPARLPAGACSPRLPSARSAGAPRPQKALG